MNREQLSGERQMDFVRRFMYVREAGTDGERQAADTIMEYLQSFGVTGRREAFSFETIRTVCARLVVTEPYEKEYPVTICRGAKNTAGEGIEAEFYYAENGDAISLADAAGKIVMINKTDDKDTWKRLEEAGALAVVLVTGDLIDDAQDRNGAIMRIPAAPGTVYAATVHHYHAVEMVEKRASKARLVLTEEKYTCESENIIARIEGTDKADEVLTLTAHYDSVPAGPGAYDNMAGAAIIMELCRYFAANRPRRSVECIWFGAEEKGLRGSIAYVTAHEAELAGHRFNMNVDLAGQLIGGNIFGVTSEKDACEVLEKLAAESKVGARVAHCIWASDSNSFAWKGVPAMTLNRNGYGMHTRFDTVDLLSAWSLERSAWQLGYITEALGMADEMPFARSVAPNLAEELETFYAGRK